MENATCHLYFLHIHTRLKARVCTENTSDAWHIPRYPTRKHCILTSIYLYNKKHWELAMFSSSVAQLVDSRTQKPKFMGSNHGVDNRLVNLARRKPNRAAAV